jgi:Zn-dependent protease
MFIPGFGAFISMRGHSITRIQDSRVGLAGPIYGFGAAVFALLLAYGTGNKTCAAIAHFGAVINLFNLIPVWQLDGSRGIASLTRQQRMLILSAVAILWLATSETMLFLIGLALVFRLFTKDAPSEPDQTGLLQFLGILSALTAVAVVAQRLAK